MCRVHFLAACIGLLLSWHYHGLSVATEPGFLDFDNLPETNFSCEGKVIGGYYADTETGCQMFHVCTIGQKGEVTDIKFLCLNGTVFDQETRVCERLDEVDCSKSESFYDLNLELYGNSAAGFGIQPENEDIPENLCEEEDEEECKTEKPQTSVKPSTEQGQSSSDERDETTTQPPLSSSTTSRRPVTSTSFPSTTPAPQILQFPSSSPETIAALLALHNAFTQSLQQHSNGKDKINPPKITGFVESLNPAKSTQEAETFEFKGGQAFSSRVPTPFPPKPQTQYNIPHSSSKSQFQSQSKPQLQNQPKPQFSSPLKPQFQNPSNPPKPLYQTPLKSQFQSQPKPPAPISHPSVTFPKPIHTTSERFGNIPFRHSFHINSQVTHFHEPNYQDQYSDHESQPSSQPQTEAPKQYDFGDYEDDYYDEKPHSSTLSPYLLHQLKVNQVQSANQAKVSESSNHGSFVRDVSSSSTKPLNVPSYRSVTTPGIAIITATSTTSSSSVKTGKPLQSAIPPFKKNPTVTSYTDSLLHSSNSNDTEQFLGGPQSYDDYKEGDVRSDPFYKDVPKISRSKRYIENDARNTNSVTTLKSLRKLKGNKLKNLFQLNSEEVLQAILNEYCNTKVNSSDSFLSYCVNNTSSHKVSDKRLGGEWEIVIPKDNKDFLYLVKKVSSTNEFQNSTSNILLLVNFPSELKLIRDSLLNQLKYEEDLINSDKVGIDIVNSSIHHRFKRVKRNVLKSNSSGKWKKLMEKKDKLKVSRKRRQAQQRQSQSYESTVEDSISLQYDNRRVRPVVRERETQSPANQQRRRKVVRKRPPVVENSDEIDSRNIHRPAQDHSEIIAPVTQTASSVALVQEEKGTHETLDSSRHRSNISNQRRRPISRPHQVSPTEEFKNEGYYSQEDIQISKTSPNIPPQRRQQLIKPQPVVQTGFPLEPAAGGRKNHPQEDTDDDPLPVSNDKTLVPLSAGRRKQGTKYHFCEGPRCSEGAENEDTPGDKEVEVSTTYPFNLKPGTTFTCDDKIKGGYYADVEAECYGYFICSQGAINGPLLKSHFWCGPTTKFNQRSRTCQAEANVACSVSHRYFHLNKDILSLPDPDDLVRDSFEPSKVKS